MKISEIIAKGSDYSSQEFELLRAEIKLLSQKMAVSQAEIMSERSLQPFPPAALELFFRREERNEKTSQVLQYLLAFFDHMPEPCECENRLLNPIAQFRECVKYEVDLLLEEDVTKAIFNEINQLSSLNGDNIWDFKGRIIEINRELHALLDRSTQAAGSLFTLFLILEQLCLFWFDVKQRDLRRIRRSDIFVFILAHGLQDRCRETSAIKT
jgi:hypothetical protein